MVRKGHHRAIAKDSIDGLSTVSRVGALMSEYILEREAFTWL